MNTKQWFQEKLATYEDDVEFRLETLIIQVTEQICAAMQQQQINRTQLAELLNISPPAVTKILNGNSNFTLKTLLSIAEVLDQELIIDFRPKKHRTQQSIPDTSISSQTTPEDTFISKPLEKQPFVAEVG
jgi:transcriptional regulator with XRE-family HTH domain